MQKARYESGLDNSAMYDCASTDQGDGCAFFDHATGTMSLLDIGMSSMAAQEAYALATLADIIGRQKVARYEKEPRYGRMQSKIDYGTKRIVSMQIEYPTIVLCPKGFHQPPFIQ
jgi:hypothetical protein